MARSPISVTLNGVAAVALAVTVAGAALAAPSGDGRAATGASPAFRVRGHIARLYPGAHGQMQVRVRNLEGFAIVLTRVAAAVRPPSAGCPASMLHVRPWTRRVRVAAKGTVRLRLTVRLRRTAPPACAGARWPLAFSGAAVRP